jgi:putative ABC transport system ATP-binding protein
MSDEPVVRICQVQHVFGAGEAQKQVLYDINLEVMPGEIVIMTGPSGSGKTTLLTLIGALRTVQAGSLQVLGHELAGLLHKQLVGLRRHIGFIFQTHNLFDSLTAYQNVKMGLEVHRYEAHEKHTRVTAILTALGLAHRMHAKPQALSGGQRQRVVVARALVHRPALVLADEPTAALDKDAGREVVTLLQQLATEERVAIVLVTHDNRILDVADRIVNMVDGRIISDVLVQESVAMCAFLAQCPAFSTLTPSTLSTIVDQMTQERHTAGTVLIRQGEVGDKFYLIRRGQCEVRIADGQHHRVINTLGEGDFFGEMVLLTGDPRSATVVTTRVTEVYTLGKDDFDAVLRASPSFKEQFLHFFFQRQ